MAIVNVSDSSFNTEVQQGTVLVDFWALGADLAK